jgi:hypothetical protein
MESRISRSLSAEAAGDLAMQRQTLWDDIDICSCCGGPATFYDDGRVEALTDEDALASIRQLKADLRWALWHGIMPEHSFPREALPEEWHQSENYEAGMDRFEAIMRRMGAI